MRRRTSACAAVLAAILLTATGCFAGSSDGEDAQASYAEVDCPEDVIAVLVVEAICGYLTVPEDRADPDRMIRLFTVRIQPPPEAANPEPVFSAGRDLASLEEYAGAAPLATRVGREFILLERRGTGRSEPDLECPEVTALDDLTLSTATDDSSTRSAYLDAVAACHDRLTGDGVDVGAYNLAAMAADADDLRAALGHETWNVISYGTASRVVLEMLRQHPDRIRAVMLDSPELPGFDPRIVALDGTRDALRELVDRCAADSECDAAYPDLDSSLAAALRMLDDDPATVTLAEAPGRAAIEVHVDAAMLLRVLRQLLADPHAGGASQVPRLVEAVVDGRADDLSLVLTSFVRTGGVPYCGGYYPDCRDRFRQVPGAYYTVLCHDIAPHADPGELLRMAGEGAGYAAAYGRSPFLDVCDSWSVGAAPATVAEPVSTDVPALVWVGAFNPYVRPEQTREGLTGFTNLTFLVDPIGHHNVGGGGGSSECLIQIRNAWIDDPTMDVDDGCLRSDIRWDLPEGGS